MPAGPRTQYFPNPYSGIRKRYFQILEISRAAHPRKGNLGGGSRVDPGKNRPAAGEAAGKIFAGDVIV